MPQSEDTGMALSESVREAAKKDLGDFIGIHDYFQARNKAQDPSVLGGIVLQGHLTNHTPEIFAVPNMEIGAIEADVFLSNTERERFFQEVETQAKAAGQDSLIDTLHSIQSNGTLLSFGTWGRIAEEGEDPEEGAAGTPVWVAGALGYREPKDRLIGPENQNMDPAEFGMEFQDRGGSFLTIQPPKGIHKQFIVAGQFALQQAMDQSDDSSQTPTDL